MFHLRKSTGFQNIYRIPPVYLTGEICYNNVHPKKRNAMTGSFLFVKPADPDGNRGTAYSGEPPRYPYDGASWEWLLERALRRTLLPWSITKSHSRVLLRGHEDKYSMHRWGSYGEVYDASVLPLEYNGISKGAYGKKTDADLSRGDRETPLPESWNSGTGAPAYSAGTKVAYGIVDLEDAVARLPFSLEWLHPGWSPAAIDAWDLSASTTEATQGSAPATSGALDWTWRTTVTHVPYTIPSEPPFKCLSHMRTDDPTVTVNITNDDNETIAVETARTTLSAPRTSYGSVRDYHGTQVRECSYGAALGAGWALSEFYILHRHGLDYGPSTSTSAYGRDGRTAESYAADYSTLGCLVDIPDKDSGNVMVRRLANDRGAGFANDVDWGGRQTWWHANGFPKGLDSVLSEKLRAQLNALCNVCQPAIPPAIPAFRNKFPDPGTVPWSHLPATLSMYEMYPQVWMRHLALACTPVDMSARLDAMTTTVHRVPTIFAKIRTVTTKYGTTRKDRIDSYGGSSSQSWSLSTNREVVTVEGTSARPIPAGDAGVSVSGQGSGVTNISGASDDHSWSDTTRYTWEEGFESDSDFLVCLRSTSNTTMSTKTTTKTSSTYESSSDDPRSSETETSDGNLPDSYDPDPDDLLFPDWVLPWIESAELFAAVESRLGRTNESDYTTSSIRYRPREGADTYSQSGSGSGTRTHKARRKIVSLGQMNLSTGRFPAVDAAAIVYDVDPDATEPTGGPVYKSSDSTTTTTIDSGGNITERTVVAVEENAGNYRSRSVSYYVVVRWKFDRKDPETLET